MKLVNCKKFLDRVTDDNRIAKFHVLDTVKMFNYSFRKELVVQWHLQKGLSTKTAHTCGWLRIPPQSNAQDQIWSWLELLWRRFAVTFLNETKILQTYLRSTVYFEEVFLQYQPLRSIFLKKISNYFHTVWNRQISEI